MTTRERAASRSSWRYVPIAGTFGWDHGWVVDDDHPFTRMMKTHGLRPIRSVSGHPFRWTTRLNGWWPWQSTRDWEAGADALGYFLDFIPLVDRNVIAVSHGGQLPILLAGSGFKLNSLITVGTPVRPRDVPAGPAVENVGAWLHIIDEGRDIIASLPRVTRLGQVGGGTRDRVYREPGIVTQLVSGIGHSDVVHKPEFYHLWKEAGWIDILRTNHSATDAGARGSSE